MMNLGNSPVLTPEAEPNVVPKGQPLKILIKRIGIPSNFVAAS